MLEVVENTMGKKEVREVFVISYFVFANLDGLDRSQFMIVRVRLTPSQLFV